jgi:hypothetical protein
MRPGPAARSHRPKTAVLARFKGNNTPRAPFFFSADVGMLVLVNNISARKNSRREVGGPAQRLPPKRQSWWSCSATASGSRLTHGGTFHRPAPGGAGRVGGLCTALTAHGPSCAKLDPPDHTHAAQ